MSSLYNISNTLLNTLADIEANDGEITEAQIEELDVKESELYEKLTDYVKAIQSFKSEANAAKEEKNRINNIQKKYTNRIERLKENMLHAVQLFGQEGKNNKFIELPIGRIYTKTSTSYEINEKRSLLLRDYFLDYINELSKNGVIVDSDKETIEYILGAINAMYKADYPDNYVPFTIGDLRTIQLDFHIQDTIFNFLSNYSNLLSIYGKLNQFFHVNIETSSEDVKLALANKKSIYASDELENITIAKETKTDSLCIK